VAHGACTRFAVVCGSVGVGASGTVASVEAVVVVVVAGEAG
jgi:hypothetical protein